MVAVEVRFKATKRRRRKFEPRVRVWKLKEEKTCEEFRCMVGDKVEAVKVSIIKPSIKDAAIAITNPLG